MILSDQRFHTANFILTGLLASVSAIYLLTGAVSSAPIKETRHTLAGKIEVERCVSCHAVEKHPSVEGHNILSEACTPCHNGMGRGITMETAHMINDKTDTRRAVRGRSNIDLFSGFSGDTSDGLFSRGEVSAGCLRCHPPQQLPQDASAVSGWRLFVVSGCGRCHQVDQVSAGLTGPDLSALGDVRSKEALMARIATPQADRFYSLMPDFSLQDEQIRNLALFLKGQSKPYLRPAGYRVAQTIPGGLVERFACSACHKYSGDDGQVAPDLDRLGSMRTPEWVAEFVQSPQVLRPGVRMPELGEAGEARRVAAQIMAAKPAKLDSTAPREFYERLCARCHGLTGDGKGLIAANLATTPRCFAQNGAYIRLAGLDKLIDAVQNGIPGTAMQPFVRVMNPPDINACVNDIAKRFAGIDAADKAVDVSVSTRPENLRGQGRVLYVSLCARCHGLEGDQAIRVVHQRFPQPRNLRNRTYMAAIFDDQIFRAIARGIPGTRMKAYQTAVPGTDVRIKASLKGEDIWRLVDHIRGLNQHEG